MRCWFSIVIGTSLAMLCASLSTAIACSDRPVNNFLLFGNSYFDTGAGNAVATADGLLLPSPTPPWFIGRHSNGPIWIDFTSCDLQIPFENFAVAGAETGSGNFLKLALEGSSSSFNATHSRRQKLNHALLS